MYMYVYLLLNQSLYFACGNPRVDIRGPRISMWKPIISCDAKEVEPELLVSSRLLVSRLEETSAKFQEVDLESYSCSGCETAWG